MINSFGAGGAYANLMVEEFVDETPIQKSNFSSPEESLLIFSAKTAGSLMSYLEKIRQFLEKDTSLAVGEVAHTLWKRNHALEQRAAIIACSARDVLEKLTLLQETQKSIPDAGIYLSFDSHADTDFSLLDKALNGNELRRLARHWVAGGKIDLRNIYKAGDKSWIALPAYAFEHEIDFSFDHDYTERRAETGPMDDGFYRKTFKKIPRGEFPEGQSFFIRPDERIRPSTRGLRLWRTLSERPHRLR